MQPNRRCLASSPFALASMPPIRKVPDNPTRGKKITLRIMQRDQTLVVRQADKGSCVVVMGKEQYLSEGLKHLDDQLVYEKLPKVEYTKALGIQLNRTYKSWLEDKLITRKLYRRLRRNPHDLRCQRMYFLHKVHKIPSSVRPIVSGVKGPTETASWVLNEALKMVLPNLPHLLLDTLEAINQLENLHTPKYAY